jgi:hypothetical protein
MELLQSKLHLKVQDHIKHSKRLVLGGGWPSGAHDNAIPRWEYLRQNKQDYLNYVIIFLREETMLFFLFAMRNNITPAALKQTRLKI